MWRPLWARHPPDLSPAYQVGHPVANGRLPEPIRHDLETVGQICVPSNLVGGELSKVAGRQPDAVEDELELGVTGQLASDTIDSSVDRTGIRLGHDKPIDLIEHHSTLDQPCEHLELLTRTSRDLDKTQIDEGPDVRMHDDLPVDNRENAVERRCLGQGSGRDEDRHDQDADPQPANTAGRTTPATAFKRLGRY